MQDAQCSMSSSQNVVNEAEDTLHAEVSAAESETIEREVLEKNDDELNGNELKSMERGNAYEKMHCPHR